MKFFMLIIAIFLIGCSNKTVKPKKEPKLMEKPLFIIKKEKLSKKVKSPKLYRAKKFKNSKLDYKKMTPYVVKGKKYRPTYVSNGDKMYGVASWYGKDFHGKKTSCGEIYDMYARTAAHKTWPMNTVVKVTNLKNKKSTVVRVNDRGPFVDGRVIDCSYLAGKEIGLNKSGIAKVKLEVLSSSKPKIAYALQVGAFKDKKIALVKKEHYKKYKKPLYIKKDKLNKLLMLGFNSYNEANNFKQKHKLNAFVVKG